MSAGARRALFGLVSYLLFLSYLLIAEIDAVGADESAAWLLAAAISSGIGVLLLGLIWLLNSRLPGQRSTVVVVIESIVIGGALSVSYLVMAHVVGVSVARDPVLLIVSTCISVGFFGYLFAVVDRSRREERERRLLLLDEGIALADAREEVADIVQRMRLVLETDIDAALSPARVGITESLGARERELSRDEWTAIALQLRTTARETIRLVSRQLWSDASPELPSPTLGRILRTIVTQQPFQPVTLAMVYVVTSLAGSVTMLGWVVGVISQIAGILMILGVLGGANALMRRRPAHHAAIFVSAAVVLQLFGLLNFPVRAWLGATPYTWLEFLLGAVLGIGLILLTSGVGSLRTHRDSVARALQADIDRELLASIAASRQVAQLARESARILHGSVQTRLISCAVAIERAARTHDVDAFEEAMREARDALVPPTLGFDDPRSLREQVEHTVSLWQGLSTVRLVIDPRLEDLRGPVARDVARVVEEGITNAITHGDAATIDISLSLRDRQIIIEVIDDGFGPMGDLPGLGSALLDSVCQEWSLDAQDVGCRMSAVITWDPAR